MKKFFKYLWKGVEFGAVICLIIFVAGKYINEDFLNGLSANQFLKHVVCSIIVAEGYTLAGMVYENERLSRGMQILIHMGTGTLVYVIVGCLAGWIPLNNGIWSALMYMAIPLGFSVVMWAGFAVYYSLTAKKINEKMKEAGLAKSEEK